MKTFQLKKEYLTKILTYKSGGVVHRKYGNALTEEFAKALVADGQTGLFVKLPNSDVVDVPVVTSGRDYLAMNWRDEILPLYAQVKERTGKSAASTKKDDIISFLKENDG